MIARTTTVLGLILLLAATPVDAAPTPAPAPTDLRVFVGTTSLRSPLHRTLAIRRTPPTTPAVAAAESQAFLAGVLPLFGADLLRAFGETPLVAAYVPAAGLGAVPPVAIGSGETLAWSPYCTPPGPRILDLVMARPRVPALVPGDAGLQLAYLSITVLDRYGEAAMFVTDLNLRGRNAAGKDTRIEPPALAVVGLGMVCLAPAPRRLRRRATPRLHAMRRLRFHRR